MPPTAFDMERDTGLLRLTAEELDREQYEAYLLTAIAIDSGNPPRTSTAFIVVQVIF